MILVNCPSCGNALNIPDQYAGMQGKCNHCGGKVTVPRAMPEVSISVAPSSMQDYAEYEKKNQQLIEAAKKGDRATVEDLLRHAANPNARDRYGISPIHEAAFRGYKPIVELLLAIGADVNAKTQDGTTPMHRASCRAQAEIVELLFSRGADLNARDKDGESPLHGAARSTCDKDKVLRVVEFLILHGANVNVQNKAGKTPANEAAESGYPEVVELLRRSGGKASEWQPERRNSLFMP